MKSFKQYIKSHMGDLSSLSLSSINESLLDDEDKMVNDDRPLVKKFLEENYKIIGPYSLDEEDGMIIINAPRGEIVVSNHKLEYLTNGLFRFGKCKEFSCSDCKLLTSIEGAPQECKRFNCAYCDSLTSLKGAPQNTKDFFCSYCESLTSIEGAPQKCVSFYCNNCLNLKSLKGAPQKCDVFNCSWCKTLTSLEGAPRRCKKFICHDCSNLKFL